MKCLSFVLTAALFCLCIASCQKHSSSSGSSPDPITQAKSWFENSVENAGIVNPANYRANQSKTLLWDGAAEVHLPYGRVVIVPIQYAKNTLARTPWGGDHDYNLSGFARVLFYQDGSQSWHAQVFTSLPDSDCISNPQPSFTGVVQVEDWQGNRIANYLYKKGQAPMKYAFSGTVPATKTTDAIASECNDIYGYNYPEGEPDQGYMWSEPGPCTDLYYPDNSIAGSPDGYDYSAANSGGGSSNTGLTSASGQNVIIYEPKSPITDIKAYFGCFSNEKGAKYQVTLCVDQPYPGSRQPWRFASATSSSGGSLIDAGHSFLIFKEITANGTNITRNVGFYPDNPYVAYFLNTTQGMLGNDQYHQYNVSGAFPVTNPQNFFDMLNYVSQGNVTGYMYNLNTNNCTTFAINTLASGGINVPATMGNWSFGGHGDDPGDLGEDLRTKNIPGVTLESGDYAHTNFGVCNE